MKTSIMLRDEITYDDDGRKTMRNHTLEVDSDDTIYSVMAQVEEMTGFPPVVQRLIFNKKSFYHDTPGTLAENELVPTYPGPVSVEVHHRGRDKLERDTLRDLGFCVDSDMLPDRSVIGQLLQNDHKKMRIFLTDYIRRDGGGRMMMLVVEPGDTVASLMEQVRSRRGYPVAMQEINVSDADNPHMDRRMDRLDATLADYNVKKDSLIKLYMSRAFAIKADREERGKVFKA